MSKGKSPQEFLCWSMDRYAAMSSFQAESDIDFSTGKYSRQTVYRRPNQFKISCLSHGYRFEAVCDGKRLVEYSDKGPTDPIAFPAPSSICYAPSLMLRNPTSYSSILYQFFGGASNLKGLVRVDKAPIDFGPEKRLSV